MVQTLYTVLPSTCSGLSQKYPNPGAHSALVRGFNFTLQLSGHASPLKTVRAGTRRPDWRDAMEEGCLLACFPRFTPLTFLLSFYLFFLRVHPDGNSPTSSLSLASLSSKLPLLHLKRAGFQGTSTKYSITSYCKTRHRFWHQVRLLSYTSYDHHPDGHCLQLAWPSDINHPMKKVPPSTCLQADLTDESSQLQLPPPKYIQIVSSE